MAVSRGRVASLLSAVARAAHRCPAHSTAVYATSSPAKKPSTDYAFEMNCANVRYGHGVTQEVGMDLVNMGAKKVCVMTDRQLARHPILSEVLKSLDKQHVSFEVFKRVRVEPTDESLREAADFAKRGDFDAYVAAGGGSVMDTCKVANLYASDPAAEFLDYVNKPIGKGKTITVQLKPMIAIPTTAGTGSETTAVAVFDYTPMKAKTGIVGRPLRPTLALVDPLHTMHMPERVAVYSGFDVLCHALESLTAIPFNERAPRPENPALRPVYQGRNPISDVWSRHALRLLRSFFERSVANKDDVEARSQMHLASTFAGIGFGNAGVHLCHGMSYPISGCVKTFQSKDYPKEHPLVPHGLSVVMTAPAVFKFTASMCPERHMEAAELLGCDVTNKKLADAGDVLADVLRKIMSALRVENGLSALGYTTSDVPSLVEGTLPQHRVTRLAPRDHTADDLATIFEESMTVF